MSFEAHSCEMNPHAMVLPLSGRLGLTTAKELGAAIIHATEESTAGLIIDMSAVEFIASSGLRELLVAYKQAAAAGKKMAMFGVSPEVYKIFKLTGFENMFSVHNDEEAAAKAL